MTRQDEASAVTASPVTASRRVRRLSPFLVVAVVALTAGLGTGAAYAYWSAGASGSGTASTGTPSPVSVVAASGTVSSTLVPGGTADLLVALNNPNTFPVTLTSVAQNGLVTGAPAGCATSGVSVPARSGLSITVASGANVVVHVPGGAAMSTVSDSACQGGTFSIPISVTVQR